MAGRTPGPLGGAVRPEEGTRPRPSQRRCEEPRGAPTTRRCRRWWRRWGETARVRATEAKKVAKSVVMWGGMVGVLEMG